MPAAGIVKAQTIKQARASYKARGRPTLGEKDARQLERAIELENRAERSRAAEARRKEALKKRTEREKQEKAEKTKCAALGSQRRHDRFGFKASQFHLGAFFKKPGELEAAMEEDGFGDEDLDDETLLGALAGSVDTAITKTSDIIFMPPSPPHVSSLKDTEMKTRTQSTVAFEDDPDSLWDELESSTQIARDLDSGQAKDVEPNCTAASFSSGDFDFTEEDLEELERPRTSTPPTAPVRLQKADQAMPPPCILVQRPAATHPSNVFSRCIQNAPTRAPVTNSISASKVEQRQMPPPAIKTMSIPQARNSLPRAQNLRSPSVPTKEAAQPRPSFSSATNPNSYRAAKPQNAIRGPFLPASSLYCSPDLGFTLSQLENFVDDDIQLTQAVPG